MRDSPVSGDDDSYSSNRKTLLPTGFDAPAGGTGYVDPAASGFAPSYRGGHRGRGRGFAARGTAVSAAAALPVQPTQLGIYNATTAANPISAYADPTATYASAGMGASGSAAYGYEDPYGSLANSMLGRGAALGAMGGGVASPQKISQGGQGCVLMLYGIDHQKLNCDMLFNVLCLYGNVLRISFMKSKSESGILEMGRPQEATNVLGYLQHLELFDLKLEFKPSHQEGVHYLREPFLLPDGTPSFRDYTESRNQRFSTPEMIARNRVVYPTTTLHWYNAPGNMDEEKIRLLLAERKAPAPVNVVVFPTRSERSSSGNVEFESIVHATEALALANHTPVLSPIGKAPYIVKFAYATPPRRDYSDGGSESMTAEPGNGDNFETVHGVPSSRGGGGFRGRGRGRGFRGRGRGYHYNH